MENKPAAIVIGLCAHGLAICRSLSRAGISVVAVEKNLSLPGTRTRSARVVIDTRIETDLTACLIELAKSLSLVTPPVLFLTNDRMVRDVALSWPQLEPFFRLSWHADRDTVLRLLNKENLEAHCRETATGYPQTLLLDSAETDVSSARFPAIVKPTKPLGSFKAQRISSTDQLREFTSQHTKSFPLILQEWIPGNSENLYVAAMIFENGSVRLSFTGQKVASKPADTGQTSVLKPVCDHAVLDSALHFFEGLQLNGPYAIEFKRRLDGSLVAIEPTIGRSDYFVDCCIANGINLPLAEYLVASRRRIESATQSNTHMWFDSERDFSSACKHIWRCVRLTKQYVPVFPYFSLSDMKPFYSSVASSVIFFVKRLFLGKSIYKSQ